MLGRGCPEAKEIISPRGPPRGGIPHLVGEGARERIKSAPRENPHMRKSSTCSGEGARKPRKSAPREDSHVEEYDDKKLGEELESSSISACGVEVTSPRVAVVQTRKAP